MPIYDEYVGALGDRDGDKDPLFVKIRCTVFEWKTVSPIANQTDTSDIAMFFAAKEIYSMLFDSGGSTKLNQQPVPKLALLPAEIAMLVVEHPTTPWEWWEFLDRFAEDRPRPV